MTTGLVVGLLIVASQLTTSLVQGQSPLSCAAVVNNFITNAPFVQNCGSNQIGASGTVQSPNYPSPYNNNASCVWNILAPTASYINLTFTAFNTEPNDRLVILLAQNCSFAGGVPIVLAGPLSTVASSIMTSMLYPANFVGLYFNSNGANALSGFSLNWTASNGSSSNSGGGSSNSTGNGSCLPQTSSRPTPCGYIQNSTSGTIQSPNYPNAYKGNDVCEWVITVPAGNYILLNFTQFYTESCCDTLAVLLPQNCSRATGLIAGNLGPFTLVVPQNRASLVFTSDKLFGYSGFNINWRSIAPSAAANFSQPTCLQYYSKRPKNCGSVQTGSSGLIQSPNYPRPYSGNHSCEWTINAPAGTVITLRVDSFNTEECCDTLAISLLNNCSSLLPGKLLRGPLMAQMISIPQNTASLVFTSSAWDNMAGFSISWTAAKSCIPSLNLPTLPGQSVRKNCGGTQSGRSGSLLSPNYPSAYPNNMLCEWFISSPTGTNITFTVNQFSTEYYADYFLVVRPDTCQQVAPPLSGSSFIVPLLYAGRNNVVVYFYADSSVVARGFNVTWKA